MAASLFAATGPAGYECQVDDSKAPQMAHYATLTRELCEEWYPKIHFILFGPDRPVPARVIQVRFEHMEPVTWKYKGLTGTRSAFAHIDRIYMPDSWTDDESRYAATFIHELTHFVQDYTARITCPRYIMLACIAYAHIRRWNPGMEWLTEGIADYVAYTYYAKSIEPRLRIDRAGVPYGYTASMPFLYGLQQKKVAIGPKDYRIGYAVVASFLRWLEVKKGSEVIRKLNMAMHRQKGSERIFKRYCGGSLPSLWRQFLQESAT